MFQNFDEYGYLGVFVALIAAGFGFPIPEELPVLTAVRDHGRSRGRDAHCSVHHAPGGDFRKWLVGDGVLYGIGTAHGGAKLLEDLGTGATEIPVLCEETALTIEQNFADRGIMVLLGARMLPGIRSAGAHLMAGILRVPLGRFLD